MIDFKITVIIKSEIVVFLHPVEELLAMQVLPLRLSIERHRLSVESVNLYDFLFLSLFSACILCDFLLFGARVLCLCCCFDHFFSSFSSSFTSFSSSFSSSFVIF